MSREQSITPRPDVVGRYRNLWLPSVGVTKEETVSRLMEEFAAGRVEISDEMRDMIFQSP